MTQPFRNAVRCRLLCLLLALWPAGLVGAAEADPETDAPAAPADAAQSPEQNTAANADTSAAGTAAPADETGGSGTAGSADKPGETPGVFVPTEDISEDFAVSFPVDI